MTDQEFLDRCAITAMGSMVNRIERYSNSSVIAVNSFEIAKLMLKERKSNMVEHKDDFSPYREDTNQQF